MNEVQKFYEFTKKIEKLAEESGFLFSNYIIHYEESFSNQVLSTGTIEFKFVIKQEVTK